LAGHPPGLVVDWRGRGGGAAGGAHRGGPRGGPRDRDRTAGACELDKGAPRGWAGAGGPAVPGGVWGPRPDLDGSARGWGGGGARWWGRVDAVGYRARPAEPAATRRA